MARHTIAEGELDAVGSEARLITKDWYPGEYYIRPHYSTMPSYLRVEDVFAPTLGPRKRRFWTKARDQALAKWSPVGFRWETIDAVEPYAEDRVTLGHRGRPAGYRWVGGVRVPAVSRGLAGCGWVHVDDETWNDAWSSRYPGHAPVGADA